MGDKAQKRLLKVLILATFFALQVPLKRLVREMVPGKRGPAEDVTEALVQGTARVAAVILASTLVRGLAGDGGAGADGAAGKDQGSGGDSVRVTVDL